MRIANQTKMKKCRFNSPRTSGTAAKVRVTKGTRGRGAQPGNKHQEPPLGSAKTPRVPGPDPSGAVGAGNWLWIHMLNGGAQLSRPERVRQV